MNDLVPFLKEEIQSLKNTQIEINSFHARLSHFVYHLEILADEVICRQSICSPSDASYLAGIINKIVDVSRLFRSTAEKKSSKNELVDCVIKRPNILAEFRRLENQFFTIADSSELLHSTKSILNSTMMQQFINELDWLNNKTFLLEMACYIDFSQDFSLKEHVSTILTLLTFLNNQPIHQSCSLQFLRVADLDVSTMRYLNTISSETSVAAAAVVKSQTAHNPSFYPSFGFNEGDLEEEHHTSIYNGFGETFRAVWKGALVSVKKIDRSVFQGGDIGLREAAACMQANSKRIKSSPFLSTLIGGSVDSSGAVFLVSPLAPLGSLYDNLTNPNLEGSLKMKISAIEKLSILMDVLHGVKHLHAHGFVHGRLKDSNVLLFGGYRAKLGDFGVQTFFSNTTRLQMKGTRGVRWTPPEILQLEVRLVEPEPVTPPSNRTPQSNNTPVQKKGPVLGMIATQFPYVLTPSVDIYAVGLLMMVLLSERMPFSNVPWEEGVRGQLLADMSPTISSNYEHYTALSSLEPHMYQCIGHFESRRPVAELIPVVEELYCSLEYSRQEELLALRNAEIAEVQKETREIGKKIKDHLQIITKGREMIARKDADKILIHVPKERRERELELDKARGKLRAFEEELVGLQEDMAGAEHDAGELFQLKKFIQGRLDFDKKHALQIRTWEDAFDQQVLLERYCTERDRDKVLSLLTSAESLEELVVDCSLPPLAVGSITGDNEEGEEEEEDTTTENPFLNVRDTSTEVTAERRKEIERNIRNGVFASQHLADSLDAIFRVPLNPNLLQNQQKAIEKHMNDIKLVSSEKSKTSSAGFVDEDELYGVAHGLSTVTSPLSQGTTTPSLHMGRTPPVHPHHHHVHHDSHSSHRSVSTTTSATTSRQVSNVSTPIDSSVSVTAASSPMHAISNTSSLDSPMTAQPQPPDSDEDHDEQVLRERQQTFTGTSSSAGHTYDQQHADQDALLEHEEEDFPTEEYDIIHCQYLSASRGDWDEAVGMRRLGLGFTDEQIERYLEENHTAAHIAATFGHLEIFRELVELGGVDVEATDTRGDSTMHCACSRGHLNIIQYLMQQHDVQADLQNNNRVTPIQIAATGGFVHVLKYFLEHSHNKLSPQFRDPVQGASLLHWAGLNSRPEAVAYLLQTFHLSIETPAETDDSTCLLWASYGGSLQVVQYLIEQANADPKAKTKGGMGCLHMATLSGSVEKTLYLMETVRLNITEKDNNHKSPFDIATGRCATFLEERKAKGFVVGSVVEKTRKVKKKHLT